MDLISLITFTVRLGLVSLLYKKKYLLSLLLSLELVLLKIIVYILYLSTLTNNQAFMAFSIFVLALSAIEARIGISLLALISRQFSKTRIIKINKLKK
ncbi:NADH-quinone oxidoreductase subunit K [Klebsiella pneumoniae]|uniref:NADH-quinone oxidoreductase subunit K n=1 Tax=Klebsiella pneumoniae TaxID=573 RepID=UPI00117A094A